MKRKRPLAMLMSTILVAGSLSFGAFAAEQQKEGTVVGIDKDAMLFVVRGSDGDQWTVSWATGSKPRGDLEAPQLRLFERVRFDYTERGGVNWLTDLDSTTRR